jgi:hypothetical protein
MGVRSIFAAVVLALSMPAIASAQSERTAVSANFGVMQFDLSGTGEAPMFAVRFDQELGNIFLAEAGFLFARPKQQFGAKTNLFIPEVQLQAQFPARFAPYLGVGAGMAFDFRGERFGGTESNVTVSGAGGVQLRFNDRFGARGELRVRGIGSEFSGSAAEWTLGANFRL